MFYNRFMLAEAAYRETSLKPWRWGTVLWAGCLMYLVVGIVGVLGGVFFKYVVVSLAAGTLAPFQAIGSLFQLPPEVQALFSDDGTVLCELLFGVPAGIAYLWYVLPPQGPPREYLGLKWPGLRQGLGWGSLILAVHFGYWAAMDWLDIPVSGGSDYGEVLRFPLLLPLAILGLAVLVPVLEEVLFRGFLLEGLRRSRLGEVGAILLTSAIWALLQEGTEARSWGFFLYGILLALARLRTGSTYLAVTVHSIANLVAVLETATG